MLPLYLKSTYVFDKGLWKRMMKYAWPVLVAGIAFTINEVFDKIMLENLLPEAIAKSEVGKYGACYRLAMFMTLTTSPAAPRDKARASAMIVRPPWRKTSVIGWLRSTSAAGPTCAGMIG